MKIVFKGKNTNNPKIPLSGAILIKESAGVNKKIRDSKPSVKVDNRGVDKPASGKTFNVKPVTVGRANAAKSSEHVTDATQSTVKISPAKSMTNKETAILNDAINERSSNADVEPTETSSKGKNKSSNNSRSSRKFARDLTKELKLQSYGLDDEYFETFQPQNIGDTIFPLNTPCYLAGQKGSGKTYLLASIIQYAYNEKLISRLFYIYADNVDSTIARAIPRSKIYAIPKTISTEFLMKFLRKKTKFTSCMNFMISYNALTKNGDKSGIDSMKLEVAPLYFDNLLDQLTKNKRIYNVGALKQYAERIITKYRKGTQLTFSGKYSYNLGKFTINDYDVIVLDDIAQFADLFGTTRGNSQLYPYFTITRQNKTTFYLTGQEVKQLPKMFREMLGAIVLLNGVNMSDISELKLDSPLVSLFREEFQHLKNYEGIIYNYNDKEYEIIKR